MKANTNQIRKSAIKRLIAVGTDFDKRAESEAARKVESKIFMASLPKSRWVK